MFGDLHHLDDVVPQQDGPWQTPEGFILERPACMFGDLHHLASTMWYRP
jgi:hypothetical protein